MSDSHDKSKTDAEMWAAFSEDAELFSEVVSLQDSHARGLCCIRCGLMDDFQQPGDKGWGMRCDWTLLPWTPNTAPDRIFVRSSCVFRGLHGRPMSPSMTFTMGVTYSLVGISCFLALGGGPNRNHFVSQVWIRGRWHKDDCLQGGIVTSSDAFGSGWHVSSVHMLVYLRSSICVATPPPYAPSSATTRSNVGRNACRVQSEPTSPSGRMG
ncbi:unnamed protein product [Ectocarpus sp. CCAP 1310/34]|nr:unnamed protein product [Ectocarpus sp. CCAP 1310/34]